MLARETPVFVAAESELTKLLSASGVQAVFLEAPPRLAWEEELETAVESGAFCLPRTELAGAYLDTIVTWLDRNLPRRPLSGDTRDALLSDILSLFHLQEAITGASVYRLRILTEAPNRRCGFHVDTVPPGVPVWGLLRVYNGAETEWVDPRFVKSMGAFYQWLQERDRLVRKYNDEPAERDARLEIWDRRPSFLLESASIERVPARTTVVFRHLDVRHHWSDHPPRLAWIHCSPMSGRPRLVVNVSAYRPAGG